MRARTQSCAASQKNQRQPEEPVGTDCFSCFHRKKQTKSKERREKQNKKRLAWDIGIDSSHSPPTKRVILNQTTSGLMLCWATAAGRDGKQHSLAVFARRWYASLISFRWQYYPRPDPPRFINIEIVTALFDGRRHSQGNERCVCVLRESLYAASSRRDTYNEFLLNFRRAGPFDWVIFHQKAQRIEKTLSAFHFRHSFPYILFVRPRRLPAAAAAALCVYI